MDIKVEHFLFIGKHKAKLPKNYVKDFGRKIAVAI